MKVTGIGTGEEEISEIYSGIVLVAEKHKYYICERDGDMWIKIDDKWFPLKEVIDEFLNSR